MEWFNALDSATQVALICNGVTCIATLATSAIAALVTLRSVTKEHEHQRQTSLYEERAKCYAAVITTATEFLLSKCNKENLAAYISASSVATIVATPKIRDALFKLQIKAIEAMTTKNSDLMAEASAEVELLAVIMSKELSKKR